MRCQSSSRRGFEIRKEVLGAEYVDRAIANATEFTMPLQEFVTSYAWGAIWGRDGLDRKTRSFLNLAMLTALNRQTELGLHVRGALRNGVTVDEIREVLLQAGGLRRRASGDRSLPDGRARDQRGVRNLTPINSRCSASAGLARRGFGMLWHRERTE